MKCPYICSKHLVRLVHRVLVYNQGKNVLYYYGCPVQNCQHAKPNKSGPVNYKRVQ